MLETLLFASSLRFAFPLHAGGTRPSAPEHDGKQLVFFFVNCRMSKSWKTSARNISSLSSKWFSSKCGSLTQLAVMADGESDSSRLQTSDGNQALVFCSLIIL